MKTCKTVSIIIPVWNQLAYTKFTVESLLKNTAIDQELVIVDNGSRPDVKGYFDSLKGAVSIRYIRNETNLGPIKAINQGIKEAAMDYIAAIHNDVVILENGWLEKILSIMEKDPGIGLVGLAGRQEIYNTGSVNEESLKHNLQNEDLNAPMEEDFSRVAVIDGLFFMARRDFWEKVGFLDEEYGYMHCYDLDLSLKSIDAGFRNIVVNISAVHLGNGGMTRKLREYKDMVKDDYGLLKRNCKILSRKWRHLLPLKV